MTDSPRSVGVLLFDDFDLLDVCGPVEILGVLKRHFDVRLIGPTSGPVSSAQGPALVAELRRDDAPACDWVLVPGGQGTRSLVQDQEFLNWLTWWSAPCDIIASVCTGSAVLAACGLLDGYGATSNKLACDWAQSQSSAVIWEPQARWVHDRDRWTSSGVAAGIDMTLALVADQIDETLADNVANGLEINWHRDPTQDSFATKNRLA